MLLLDENQEVLTLVTNSLSKYPNTYPGLVSVCLLTDAQ